jgi:predicted dehydrogenase
VSRPWRVAIVGVGSIGERHVRCFAATGRAEVVACEVNPALRRTVAERYGLVRSFDTLDAALADGIDAAVIATPAHLHIPLAAAAVRAGVAVLVEKPLSTTPDGVADLCRTATERGVLAGVAYVYRANPVLSAMRAAIRSGRFGEPVQIVATCGQHFPLYRPAYREIYYKERSTGGGAVQDALTHILNAGEWLVGSITSVAADIGHLVLDGVDVEDTAHVIARHGPVMGCFSLNQYQAPNEVTITVVCRGGTARFESHANRWRWAVEPGGPWTDEVGPSLERDTLFTAQANAFFDTLDNKAEPLCSLAEGAHTLQVNLAVLEAADGRCWVDITNSVA